MHIVITRATAKDRHALVQMDKKCFRREDCGTKEYFATRGLRTFWVLQDTTRVGATGLIHDRTYSLDTRVFAKRSRGTLYITSTAVVPEYQRCGVGGIIKLWQIACARNLSFSRILTHARASNTASIQLNKKFGFIETERLPGYYFGTEDAIVHELAL